MVMKTYFKTILRTVKTNTLKFIALISIIFVGVCFVTGVGGITPKIKNSFNDELKANNAPDIVLKSKKDTGFTSEEIDKIRYYSDTRIYSSAFNVDKLIDEKQTRLMNYDIKSEVNKLQIISGSYPTDKYDCVVEEATGDMTKINIGDHISYSFNEFFSIDMKVTGIVKNPLIYSVDGEPTIEEGKDNINLDRIIYLDSSISQLDFLPTTDIYLCLNSTVKLNLFTKKYLDQVNEAVPLIRNLDDAFSKTNCASLTMEDNKSYIVLTNITDKIDVIANIFPFFFIVVVALVALTTMSRLISEERNIIGCYRSMGYTNSQIQFKYVCFSLLSTIIGTILGVAVGAFILPNIIYPAFGNMFVLPSKMTNSINIILGVISSICIILAVIIVTVYELAKELKQTPAMLLQPKAPKPGKKIFLEKIPFVWNHLKFKFKSTFRNIFRYVGRLLMVVISVAGSSALVMAGFGLYDVSKKDLIIGGILMNISSTLSPVALIIVIFALLLCMLVLFNLINMNIQERKREIATLEVLGYFNIEVYGYIFREVIIMSLIGIIVGIPLGVGLLAFIFNYLNFGGLGDVEWYSYFFAFGCTFIFVILVSFMLIGKIKSIDMNESLKSIE